MEFLSDPLLWILCLVGFLIIVGPWAYKNLIKLFRGGQKSSHDECIEKINCLINIRSGVVDGAARNAIDSVILVLIQEHGSHV